METEKTMLSNWIQPEIIKNEKGEELNRTPIMVTNSLTRTKVIQNKKGEK